MALSRHGGRAQHGLVSASTRPIDARPGGISDTRRTVEVFADVRCPFTHVGLLRFVARRHELAVDNNVSLVVRAWPLELVNGAPLDARMISQKVRALREQVAPTLFQGFDEDAFPATSMPALMLEAAARRQSVEIGERVSLALRDALFEHGRDIAAPDVLREVAASCGMAHASSDTDRVIADWLAGQRRGVIGSPHFFAAAGDWFCPSLTITHRHGALHIADNRDGFDRFASACLRD